MTTGPVVLRNPIATIADVATPTTEIDISCWVARAEITPSTDTVDLKTFCNPEGQAEGATTWEVSIDWKSSHESVAADDLYTKVQPVVGKDVILTLQRNAAATKAWQGTIGMVVNPALAGAWEPGQPITATTSHALRATPTIVTATVMAAGASAGDKKKAA